MARPNRMDPERFGRLDGLLPKAEGRITTEPTELPKELDIAGLPEGEWVERGVYRMTRDFVYGEHYGKNRLLSPCESGRALELWGGSGVPVFLDTETTGLSGGTGTYAFLVGLGFCTGRALRVVQLFLAGPAWERSWLAALEAELPREFSLVTYNGRAFDLPLLRTRYTLSRAVPSWNEAQHLDLLLLARHFYRGRLSSCSLGSMEKNVLGLGRSGEDIPGSEIPWIYTQYLRSQNARPLKGIFYHNTLDIVSLAALQRQLASLACGGGNCAAELVRAGDLWAARGEERKAAEIWAQALDFPQDRNVALVRLAEREKAAGSWQAAYDYYRESLETEKHPVPTLTAMAKLAEHKLRRCDMALKASEQALLWLDRHRIFRDKDWAENRKALRHRIERLEKKLGRNSSEEDDEEE